MDGSCTSVVVTVVLLVNNYSTGVLPSLSGRLAIPAFLIVWAVKKDSLLQKLVRPPVAIAERIDLTRLI